LIVTSLCILTVAGCGRTIVRETVVERPVAHETVVERPVVVERPAVALAAPASCNLAGAGYATGSLTCQAGYHYRCSSGVWERIPGSMC
jgi:hypothetical protein